VEAAPRTNTMGRQKILFWIGTALYTVSFAIPAVADMPGHQGSDPGWVAAITAIWVPLAFHPYEAGGWVFQDTKLAYVSILIGGLINPLFLVTVILAAEGYQRAIAISRIILLLMIPFCWLAFYLYRSYPREGHFFWILGMVLVLFSGFLQSDSCSEWEQCPWCSGKNDNCPRCAGSGWILVGDQPKLRREIHAKWSAKNG